MLKGFEGRVVDKGYSPKYAQRLADELRDHIEDAVDDLVEQGFVKEEAQRLAQERIGKEELLLDAVEFSNLKESYWRSKPVRCFLVAPVLVYLSAVFGLFFVGVFVGDLLQATDLGVQLWVSEVLSAAPLILGVILSACLWRIALSHRCDLRWPLGASIFPMYIAANAKLQTLAGSGELTLPGSLPLSGLVMFALLAMAIIASHFRRPELQSPAC